jgi:hypothetical protein
MMSVSAPEPLHEPENQRGGPPEHDDAVGCLYGGQDPPGWVQDDVSEAERRVRDHGEVERGLEAIEGSAHQIRPGPDGCFEDGGQTTGFVTVHMDVDYRGSSYRNNDR